MTEPQESHGILKVSKKDTTVKKFHWNEDNLEENEKIQKELVCFSFFKIQNPTKITEPKTPYSYWNQENEDIIEVPHLQEEENETEIKQEGKKKDALPIIQPTEKSEWDESEEEEEEEGEIIHDPNFEKKRKAHYNEFEMIKKMRQQQQDEEDEEEEEEEEEIVIVK
jgi:hypothetical protein